MQVFYTYNGTDYHSEWEVRMAIQKNENKRLGEVEGKPSEFWPKNGVAYTERPDPEPTLDDLKAAKKTELEAVYLLWRNETGYFTSSIGFRADGNSRAMMDIVGLDRMADKQPKAAITFRDYDNKYQRLTAEQVHILADEITAAANDGYQQKWEYEKAINEAADKNAIKGMKIEFKPADYSTQAEV